MAAAITLRRPPEVSKLAYRLPVAEPRTPYQVAPDKLSIMQIVKNLSARQRTTLLATNNDMPNHDFPQPKSPNNR